jgi:hypothetical protein
MSKCATSSSSSFIDQRNHAQTQALKKRFSNRRRSAIRANETYRERDEKAARSLTAREREILEIQKRFTKELRLVRAKTDQKESVRIKRITNESVRSAIEVFCDSFRGSKDEKPKAFVVRYLVDACKDENVMEVRDFYLFFTVCSIDSNTLHMSAAACVYVCTRARVRIRFEEREIDVYIYICVNIDHATRFCVLKSAQTNI